MALWKVPLTLATTWRSSTWTSEWWTRFTTSSWTSTSASCPSSGATSTTSLSFARVSPVGFKRYFFLPDMSLNLIQKLSLLVFGKGSSDKFEKLCEESESRQEYCTTAYLYNITQGRKRTKWTKTSSIKKFENVLIQWTPCWRRPSKTFHLLSSLAQSMKSGIALLKTLLSIIYCGFWFKNDFRIPEKLAELKKIVEKSYQKILVDIKRY